jgi:hypothetical protein
MSHVERKTVDGGRLKKCTRCLKWKNNNRKDFAVSKECKDNTHTICRSCHARYNKTPDQARKNRERAKKRRAELNKIDPRIIKAQKIKTVYGLSRDQYEMMFEDQEFKCAVCITESVQPYTTYSHIDHHHASGKVRGILCRECNIGLGRFKENIESLERAIVYLRNSA